MKLRTSKSWFAQTSDFYAYGNLENETKSSCKLSEDLVEDELLNETRPTKSLFFVSIHSLNKRPKFLCG